MAFVAVGIGTAVGIGGLVGKAVSRSKANERMDALLKENPIYKKNPIVEQQMGLAKTLLNARAPGAVAQEQNIATTQGNMVSNAQRGATDSAQLLATGGAIQSQSNNAYAQLGEQEAADYQRRYGNVVTAENANIQEDDKVFEDGVRRYSDKVGVEGAKAANRAATWGDISKMGFSVANFASNGGFGKGGGNSGSKKKYKENWEVGDDNTMSGF
jgi:hypothetical protein